MGFPIITMMQPEMPLITVLLYHVISPCAYRAFGTVVQMEFAYGTHNRCTRLLFLMGWAQYGGRLNMFRTMVRITDISIMDSSYRIPTDR